ncbi:MAG TPA: signal peptidase I [Candidatus Polarisedimenticolia bacterium]|jgi:signal peptidase I|nr:signal peptidase I [Candidatus Polarisedimenticolia bacterium]
MAISLKPRRFVFEYTQAGLVAIIFALFVRTFLFQPFTIPSPSMEDTLLVGDYVLVNKFALTPLASAIERAFLPIAPVRRGDVIVFRYPHDERQDYVKRAIALPGETIKIVDRVVYIQKPGQEGYVPLIEPYGSHKYPGSVPYELDNFGPLAIPEGQYFVMGDNRDDSRDSREWGLVPRDHIVGRGILIYWSFEGRRPDGAQAAGRRPDSGVHRLLTSAGAFFTDTRWERTFRFIR